MCINFYRKRYQAGVTLIELVIFILIMSIALTAITLVYIQTTRQSSDPVIRIKSIELAQLTLNEILLKKYDDMTPTGGGCVQFADSPPGTPTSRCASGISAETESSGLGAEVGDGETTRIHFDDVDDYQGKLYCGDNVVTSETGCVNVNPSPTPVCEPLLDESGVNISTLYAGFSVCINVSFAGGINSEISFGLPADQIVRTNDAKRIDVTVTDTVKSKIRLTAYSLNY
jgi:MSHA pilin protein MshD